MKALARPIFLGMFTLLAILAVSCGFPRPPEIVADGGTSADSGAGSDGNPSGSSTTFQLLATEPTTAAAGDTVFLEGTFASAVTVDFPGSVSQAAVVLGAHRASVVVPQGATAGTLSIQSGGSTIGQVPFRKASYALGLQSFQGFYDQSGGAHQQSTLVTARASHATLVVGNYLYVLGGSGSSGFLQSVERARINADGSLGFFADAGTSLLVPRAQHMCIVVGSFLYVLGGIGNAGVLASVERASINSDGTVGAFSAVPDVALATPRRAATQAIIGNVLYVLGGAGSTVLRSVERATIEPDGSLGPFSTASDVALMTGRTGHASVVIGSSLYVLGGSDSNGVVGTVERAAIAGDGTLGAFALTSSGLKTARANHSSIVIGSSLYVLGGAGTSATLASVEQATIGDDGTPGAFSLAANSSLLVARSGQTSTLVENSLYLVGGTGVGGSFLSSVERSSIDAGGALHAFSFLPNGNVNGGSNYVSIGTSLYVFAGGNVSRATVAADGTIGPFTPVSALATPIGVSPVVIRNRLYLFGAIPNGLSLTSFIGMAIIGPDGTVGPLSTVSNVALVTPRSTPQLVVVGNSLFVMGGSGVFGESSGTYEQAVINGDGTLGPFATVGNGGVNATGATTMVIRNFIYIIGGDIVFAMNTSPSIVLATVSQAAIHADGTVDPFTTLSNVSLGTARYGHMSVVVGGYLYVIGGSTSFTGTGNQVASIERAVINADGTLGSFEPFSVSLNAARAGAVVVPVGNALYVLGGGANGAAATQAEQAILQ